MTFHMPGMDVPQPNISSPIKASPPQPTKKKRRKKKKRKRERERINFKIHYCWWRKWGKEGGPEFEFKYCPQTALEETVQCTVPSVHLGEQLIASRRCALFCKSRVLLSFLPAPQPFFLSPPSPEWFLLLKALMGKVAKLPMHFAFL